MAITVGTNSWVTLAEANLYMDDRFNNTSWLAATDGNKSSSLITAFRWIFNSQKFNIPKTSTADIVKEAQIELANYILVNMVEHEKRRALQTQGVEDFKVSKWEEKFLGTASIPQFIEDMLTDYLQNLGGKFFTVSRKLNDNNTTS